VPYGAEFGVFVSIENIASSHFEMLTLHQSNLDGILNLLDRQQAGSLGIGDKLNDLFDDPKDILMQVAGQWLTSGQIQFTAKCFFDRLLDARAIKLCFSSVSFPNSHQCDAFDRPTHVMYSCNVN
jgi:hypothetical protein